MRNLVKVALIYVLIRGAIHGLRAAQIRAAGPLDDLDELGLSLSLSQIVFATLVCVLAAGITVRAVRVIRTLACFGDMYCDDLVLEAGRPVGPHFLRKDGLGRPLIPEAS